MIQILSAMIGSLTPFSVRQTFSLTPPPPRVGGDRLCHMTGSSLGRGRSGAQGDSAVTSTSPPQFVYERRRRVEQIHADADLL